MERAASARRLQRRSRRRLVLLACAFAALVGTVAYAVTSQGGRDSTRIAFLHHGASLIDDLTESGVDQAVSELKMLEEEREVDVEGADDALHELSTAGHDLIIVLTLETDVASVARLHPRTRYVVMQSAVDAPNVSYFSFADHEGSYLVGAAAAMKSQTGTVAFLGGVQTEAMRNFEVGFAAGAQAAKPGIRVLTAYITSPPDYSGFFDSAAAGVAATRLFESGADVVFPAAGSAQYGAFQAAITLSPKLGRHLWAIGADEDAYDNAGWQRTATSRDHILTSVVKRFDVAAARALREHERGTLAVGRVPMNLANGGVSLSYRGGFLDGLRSRLDAMRAEIVSGARIVPCVPEHC
jgi:basic membrane protein A